MPRPRALAPAWALLLPLVFGAGLIAAACAERGVDAPTRAFDSTTAFSYVSAQLAMGPRYAGAAGHERMKAWLDSLARQRADTVIVQDWEHLTSKGKRLRLRNVLARFNPQAAKRILYVAHWDTRPFADQAPAPGDRVKPVPGANDGASGVALLLGVADALRLTKPAIGVDLLFVDGEDFGDFSDSTETLLGSRYYARHQAPGPAPLFAVVWDMVGDKDPQFYHEGNSLLGAPEVVNLVWDAARVAGATAFQPSPKHTVTDDHTPLQQVGIRAIDVIDFDYPPWHTPDDTIDKVSAATLGQVGRVALRVIQEQEK